MVSRIDEVWKFNKSYLNSKSSEEALIFLDSLDKNTKKFRKTTIYYALEWSAKNGHTNVLKYLLALRNDSGKLIYKSCSAYDRAVIKAAEQNHLDIVKILTAVQDDDGVLLAKIYTYEYSLMIEHAVLMGNIKIFEYLLSILPNIRGDLIRSAVDNGLDMVKYVSTHPEYKHLINADNYADAISDAAEKGHLDILKFLLVHNGKVSVNESFYFIYSAALSGKLEIVAYLANLRDDLNNLIIKPCEQYYEAISKAAFKGYAEIVKYLVNLRDNNNKLIFSSTNTNFNNPIKPASKGGHIYIVQYLAQLKNESGDLILLPSYSSISFAAKSGHFDIVKYLTELRDDNNTRIHNCKHKFHDIISTAVYCNRLEFLEYFLTFIDDNGKLVDNFGYVHEKFLNIAASSGFFDIVEYLANFRNDNGNLVTKDHYGAIIGASEIGSLKIVKYLAKFRDDNGKLINYYKNYDSAMYCAAMNNHLKVVKFIASLRDDKGKMLYEPFTWHNPLKHANLSVIKFLTIMTDDDGKLIFRKKDYYRQVIKIAAKNNNLAKVKYLYKFLIEHGIFSSEELIEIKFISRALQRIGQRVRASLNFFQFEVFRQIPYEDRKYVSPIQAINILEPFEEFANENPDCFYKSDKIAARDLRQIFRQYNRI